MSNAYEMARECFQEAQIHAKNDKIIYNLLAGLVNLTAAMEKDAQEIRNHLAPLHGGTGLG
jgi:hypothetical protein